MCDVYVHVLSLEKLMPSAQFRKENAKYDLEYMEISHF